MNHARNEQRILEVCCATVECVIAADAGGGDRIELCENLEVGGVTPSGDLLRAVKARTSLQVFVLIRCRAGDFRFTENEVSGMIAQIENARQLGADGIVCGALSGEGKIDGEATSRFITAAGPLPFTFHRAFDDLNDQSAGLIRLRELGAKRVLSSAGLREACEDPQRLQELAVNAGGRPGILACGGIRSTNIGTLAAIREIREFHSAARSTGDGVDVDEVRSMKAAITRE